MISNRAGQAAQRKNRECGSPSTWGMNVNLHPLYSTPANQRMTIRGNTVLRSQVTVSSGANQLPVARGKIQSLKLSCQQPRPGTFVSANTGIHVANTGQSTSLKSTRSKQLVAPMTCGDFSNHFMIHPNKVYS